MPELKLAEAAAVKPAPAQVLAEGNYAELSKDERVKEAYLGAGHA